jgi:hypothetical protein
MQGEIIVVEENPGPILPILYLSPPKRFLDEF